MTLRTGLKDTFSVAEVARSLGISARWLADQCRAGRVVHEHVARQRRFTPEQYEALIAQYTVTPASAAKLDATKARVLRRLERGS